MTGAEMPKLGIIAGRGALPGLLAAACRASGRPHHVLGLAGFAEATDLVVDNWVRLGDIGKAFAALTAAGVKEVVMAGGVRRPTMTELMPDLKGAAFLARIAGKALGDDGLLSAVIAEIEREGFKVVGADSILAHLLAPEGVMGTCIPDEDAWNDIRRGFDVVRLIGAADVGQAAVVQQGIVLGVEAAEGTDALIARCKALRLNAPGGVLVKAKKPQQERRADLPAVGIATVRNAKAAGLAGIAVEAGNTLMVDGPRDIAAAADAEGLFIVGVKV
jgi:DUF1009 family protein